MTLSPARTRGRPCAFDRDAALQAAMLEFWAHGYDSTSIAALTTAMDIRPPSLYAAFGDKRRLFGECIRLYQSTHGRTMEQILQGAPTGFDAVRGMLEFAADDYTDASHPPGCLIITATASHGPASAEVEDELRVLREAGTSQAERRIQDDIDAGRLPADADAARLARFYTTVLQGMSRQAQDGASAQELREAAAMAMRAWPA
ncbi:TetR/AcrR family transcriptional regulator [Herbiconiux sp. P18]|uniref:TetR/AcrR family transcriptional regulator n=1 Tax=Herbiconiux liangxiaofengii TaxID=3342795 RepID=UPI0035B6C6B7